jgi:peptidoglycan/LPS O-acetylase OafA/YrhL
MHEDRLRYLDGLRGILAIIVFLHHFFYAFYPDIIFGGQYFEEYLKPGWSFDKIMAFTPLNLFFNPGMAIHFFFFLSAYVQSYHYLKDPDLTILQKSFLKRYFRLAVPVLVTLLLIYLFHSLHLVSKYQVPKNPITEGWTSSMLPNSLKILVLIKHALLDSFITTSRYYQVLWTMPIELMNSYLVLIILFVTHNLKNRAWLFFFWLLVQLFVLRSYYGAAFTAGLLICYSQINLEWFTKFFNSKPVKLFCFVTGIYFASYPFIGYQNSTNNGLYAPISFFEKYPHIISYFIGDLLLFCFVLHSNKIKNLLSHRIFRFFGDISFMLYLLHLLIILSLTPKIFHFFSFYVGRHANLCITLLITFAIVSGLSALFYRFIDLPVLRNCSKLIKKFFDI